MWKLGNWPEKSVTATRKWQLIDKISGGVASENFLAAFSIE